MVKRIIIEAISRPGELRGPCIQCDHKACLALRTAAETDCPYCREPVGYRNAFAVDSLDRRAHYNCLPCEIFTPCPIPS